MLLGVFGLDGLDQVSHTLWSGQDPANLCDQPKGTTCRSVLEDDWITLLPTTPHGLAREAMRSTSACRELVGDAPAVRKQQAVGWGGWRKMKDGQS